MSERANLEASNITVGRQDWDKNGRLLGAGIGPGATVSELSLSANPRAMGHGVVQPSKAAATAAAPPTAATVAAAPAGPAATTTVIADSLKAYVQPSAAKVTRYNDITNNNAAPTVVRQTVPATRVSRGSEYSTRASPIQQQRLRQQRSPADAKQSAAISSSSSRSPATPGHAEKVAPQQQAWYATAWQRVKSVLFAPANPLELGPPWTKWPDYDRLNNINALLAGLWPTLSDAVEQQLVMQMVPDMMKQAAADYGAGYLTELKLLHFDLGKVPPRVDGLKVYDENIGDDQLLLEVAVSWGSTCKVTVGATLALLGRILYLPITINNLQVHAVARISASPMMQNYPYIGALGVSLIEPPHVDFELPIPALGNLDAMALPMVRGAFRHGVKLAARQFLVFPKGIQVPLDPRGGAAGAPAGMLEVKLVRVSGLRSEDLIGQSDPYVILRLREGRELRSRTVNNRNNPEYNQTFKMLVEDIDAQVLQLIVMDEDLVSFQNKVIGVAQVPLKDAAFIKVPKTKVPVTLNIHKLMGPTKGLGALLAVPVQVAGLPITAAAKGGQFVYHNLAGALGVSGKNKGSGRDNKDQYSRVLDETGWLGPSQEYLEEQQARNNGSSTRNNAVGEAVGSGSSRSSTGRTDAQQQQQQPGGDVMGYNATATTPTGATAAAGGRSPEAAAAAAAAAAIKPGSVAAASPFGAATAGGKAVRVRRPSEGAGVDDESAVKVKLGSRLASQSAPLADVYQPQQQQQQPPGQQQQNQQQQGERDTVKEMQQGMATGKDAKNLEGNQVKSIYRGTAYLELTYTPFKRPEVPPTGAGASPAAAHISAGKDVKPTDVGILSVTVVRAKGLTGFTGEADPYVTLSIMQTAGGGTPGCNTEGQAVGSLNNLEEFRSNTIYNEDSPRWNEKFDFIMIPAGSVLLLTVWDQTSVVEAVTSLSLSRERFKNHVLGRVKVPVLEVAAAGRIRSMWPLQGAIMGELEMILQWIPASLME